MSASIATPPADRVFSRDQTWVVLETSETIAPNGSIVLTITSTGPTAGETIEIEWGGNDLVFTVSGTDSESATDLPVIGADTLSVYADNFAERLRQNEALHDYFAISRGTAGADETVTLTQRLLEVVDITVTNGLTNVSEVVTDVSAVTAASGLRALLEVWLDTGDPATDEKLISLHSPYDLVAASTKIDIQAAFARLTPHLPSSSSINPAVFISLLSGEATACWLQYYLRYADKAGYPAVAQALLQSDPYVAILGATAADSGATTTAALRHNYARRDGATFRKPCTPTMPDWLYWVCPRGVTEIYIHVSIDWSDGTSSTFDPFHTHATTVEAGKMYWIGTGFRQLLLHTVTPSGGTDPDAYIVAYNAAIARVDAVPLLGAHNLTYDVYYDGGDFAVPFLLFSNGMGGCETACFRGKQTTKYRTAADEVQRPRPYGWTVSDGEFSTIAANGRAAWDISTGWYTDPYYLEHLRHLALADGAWLIDTVNRKFRRVIVEPGELEVSRDDETLFSLSFSIRAAWLDEASNV